MCDVVGALIVSSTSVAGEGNQLECPVEDAGSCSRLFVLESWLCWSAGIIHLQTCISRSSLDCILCFHTLE